MGFSIFHEVDDDVNDCDTDEVCAGGNGCGGRKGAGEYGNGDMVMVKGEGRMEEEEEKGGGREEERGRMNGLKERGNSISRAFSS